MTDIDTSVDWDTWLSQLKARFVSKHGMTEAEANSYVYEAGDDCWRDYYHDEFTAEDAADEDATYWD